MDKKKILFVGIGACGNKILNELLHKDLRFKGLFVNTTELDFKNLDKANIESNVFLMPNANGTAKDRQKAKQYAQSDLMSLMDILAAYKQQTEVFVIFSMGGGTGSGIAPLMPAIFAQKFPNKKINMIGVKPSLKSSKRVLENTIDCWNDLIKMKQYINSFMFIDNDKRKNEKDINRDFANSFNDALNISVASNNSVIDEADLSTLMTAKGCTHIYQIENKKDETIRHILKQSIHDSVLVEPEKMRCEYLGLSLIPDEFSIEDLEDEFKVREDIFYGENNKNIIIMSGCRMPSTSIELIEEELKDRESAITNNDDNDDDDLIIEIKKNKIIKKEPIKNNNSQKDLNKNDVQAVLDILKVLD